MHLTTPYRRMHSAHARKENGRNDARHEAVQERLYTKDNRERVADSHGQLSARATDFKQSYLGSGLIMEQHS